MDATLKLFSDELKRILKVESGKRLKKTDWEQVYTMVIGGDCGFSLNESTYSFKEIKWDLHNIFKFTHLKTLYIQDVPDHLLLSAGGIEALNFRFWFDKLPRLNGLNLKLGSAEDHKEAHCYKVELSNSVAWVLHIDLEDGYAVEVWTTEGKQKSFYFGKDRKANQWFLSILEFALANKELPTNEWYEELKLTLKEKSMKEKHALFKKIEDRPEVKEFLY